MNRELPLKATGQIRSGIGILGAGGLVAFPTDTVYGLGACFDNIAAIENIYRLKKRPYNMGLPLLVADRSQINEVVKNISHIADQLIERFMPGGLTLIMPKNNAVPDVVTGGSEAVAIRIPAHPIPVALIRGIGKPIIGTSANISGKPSPITATEVYAQFGDGIDLIIDGGRCEGGRESTIVDVTGEKPRILRESAIPRDEIRQVFRLV